MRLTQLAQVIPTTGSVSSAGSRVMALRILQGSIWHRLRRRHGMRSIGDRRRPGAGIGDLTCSRPTIPHQARHGSGAGHRVVSNDVRMRRPGPAHFGSDRGPRGQRRRSSSWWMTTSRRSSCCVTSPATSGWNTSASRAWRRCGRPLDRRLPTLLIVDDDLPDGRGGDLARDLRTTHAWTAAAPRVHGGTPTRLAEIGSWAPVVAKPFDARRDRGVPRGRRASQRRRPRVRASGRLG